MVWNNLTTLIWQPGEPCCLNQKKICPKEEEESSASWLPRFQMEELVLVDQRVDQYSRYDQYDRYDQNMDGVTNVIDQRPG